MITYQDFIAEPNRTEMIKRVINDHRSSADYDTAVTADLYDRQQNVTINKAVRTIFSSDGQQREDPTASNNRIASNFFRRLITQRCTYSLGNGLTYDTDGVKEKMGPTFDTDVFNVAYNALKHGVGFGFWNVDKLHIFPLTQFAPLYDEEDGALRAGIRYWSIDWLKRPVFAVVYEEDGYTKYRANSNGLDFREIEPKRGYKQTIAHTEAEGDVVIGETNYGTLPIVPLWPNKAHQSALVGMRSAIDSYDIIQSGFANDISDCAQIYWLIGNALGMNEKDLKEFRERLIFQHIAVVDTDNSSVTPHTQDIPFNAREAYLNHIAKRIYTDFGAFDPSDITSRQVTATEINAAYQPMDEEADAFEYFIIEFVQRILRLNGIEATPQFKRNRISVQSEMVDMILAAAQFLDLETILEKLPFVDADEIPKILARLDNENARRTPEAETEEETEGES